MRARLRIALLVVAAFMPSLAAATEVKEITSPGGIKAWLVEEHALPLIAVKIAFKDSGVAYDPAGKEGRAAMSAAMLTEGAGDMDAHAFNEALENNAIRMDFAVDEDLFRASMESLSEHAELAFSYLGLALSKPRLDDDALERVRRQTLATITQQEEQPAYKLSRAWEKLVFGAHPYANPSLGTPESAKALAKADLQEFAQHYLTRGNMLVAVVGDITPEALGTLLDAHLGGLPEHYAPDTVLKDASLATQGAEKAVTHDIPQTMVMFGAPALKRNDPDYYAAYVLNQILGGSGSLTAKLSEELREKRGLTYSVFTQLDPMMHAAVWRGSFATRREKTSESLDTLKNALAQFAQDGPTDEEMARAKQYLTGSFVLNLDSNGEIANYLIAMQLHQLGRDYLDKRNSLMEAVTKEQVAALAKRLADPAHLFIVTVGKQDK